ncbi:MAG: hypothetical protein MJ123_02710 [Lachnospiraceae bacterium]|nr:hypothetical protein [Lachnospiraceae bacterium]
MGTIVAILLKILQVIGIVLLSILALILFAGLLVLFVPIRYKAEGGYNDGNYSLKAKASWLLHIVSVSFDMVKGNETALIIKIFGHDLSDKDDSKKAKGKRKKSKRKKKSNRKRKSDNSAGESIKTASLEYKEPTIEDFLDDDTEEIEFLDDSEEIILLEDDTSEHIEEEKNDDNNTSDADALKNDNESNVISDSTEELNEKKTDESDDDILERGLKKKHKKKSSKEKKKKQKDSKETNIYDKIKGYVEVIKSDDFKKAFEVCKKQVIKLLKAVLPKSWSIDLDLAFTNPEKYGKSMAYYGMFFALLYKHVNFSCVADDDYIKVTGKCKGRIYIITLLIVLTKVYFNKKIRKLIKMFKEEE